MIALGESQRGDQSSIVECNPREKEPQATNTRGVFPSCVCRRLSLSWGKLYGARVIVWLGGRGCCAEALFGAIAPPLGFEQLITGCEGCDVDAIAKLRTKRPRRRKPFVGFSRVFGGGLRREESTEVVGQLLGAAGSVLESRATGVR